MFTGNGIASQRLRSRNQADLHRWEAPPPPLRGICMYYSPRHLEMPVGTTEGAQVALHGFP